MRAKAIPHGKTRLTISSTAQVTADSSELKHHQVDNLSGSRPTPSPPDSWTPERRAALKPWFSVISGVHEPWTPGLVVDPFVLYPSM